MFVINMWFYWKREARAHKTFQNNSNTTAMTRKGIIRSIATINNRQENWNNPNTKNIIDRANIENNRLDVFFIMLVLLLI